jgi:hypothetical protein
MYRLNVWALRGKTHTIGGARRGFGETLLLVSLRPAAGWEGCRRGKHRVSLMVGPLDCGGWLHIVGFDSRPPIKPPIYFAKHLQNTSKFQNTSGVSPSFHGLFPKSSGKTTPEDHHCSRQLLIMRHLRRCSCSNGFLHCTM